MRSVLRTQRTMAPATRLAIRGGFHKPDPKPYADYKNTRRVHLEDVNTVLYSDMAPEFHMHLHSIQIQSGKTGWYLLFMYFCGIIFPCWCVARTCHANAGANLF